MNLPPGLGLLLSRSLVLLHAVVDPAEQAMGVGRFTSESVDSVAEP
jgi:hypothetical protein